MKSKRKTQYLSYNASIKQMCKKTCVECGDEKLVKYFLKDNRYPFSASEKCLDCLPKDDVVKSKKILYTKTNIILTHDEIRNTRLKMSATIIQNLTQDNKFDLFSGNDEEFNSRYSSLRHYAPFSIRTPYRLNRTSFPTWSEQNKNSVNTTHLRNYCKAYNLDTKKSLYTDVYYPSDAWMSMYGIDLEYIFALEYSPLQLMKRIIPYGCSVDELEHLRCDYDKMDYDKMVADFSAIYPYYYMNTYPYDEYLKTLYWHNITHKVLYQNDSCCMCGSTKTLQVHHTTYEHVGFEYKFLDDLIVVCGKCHKNEHKLKKFSHHGWEYKKNKKEIEHE